MKTTVSVAFIGAPNTGKTYLSRLLEKELRSRGLPVTRITEYAREFIRTHGPIRTEEDQIYVLEEHFRRESALLTNQGVVISDSPIYLNFLWSTLFYDVPVDRKYVEDLYLKHLNDTLSFDSFLSRYDHLFFLDELPEASWSDDTGRMHGIAESRKMHNRIAEFLDHYALPHHTLSGPLSERLLCAQCALEPLW